jgi:hypothetical protein
VFLITSVRQSLLRNIEQYRKGWTSFPRNRTLSRFFKARAAADQLVQEIADAAGIALPGTLCINFKDTEEPAWLGFLFFQVGIAGTTG